MLYLTKWCYLFVFLRELAVVDVRVLVNDLRYCDHLIVSVLHGHAEQRVSVVPSDAVYLIVEPGVLQSGKHRAR